MITKKDIPLDLLKAVEEIARENHDIIQLKKEENTYYNFIEKDQNSKNYFKVFIDGSKVFSGFDSGNYVCEWKPSNTSSSGINKQQAKLQGLVSLFKAWITIIRSYNELESIHDDPFVKKYADFYFNEFKIYDTDAEISPFDPDQQDVILLYLDTFVSAIEKKNIDQDEKAEWIVEIKGIKNSLTTRTKSQVIKSITNIFGKIHKRSADFAKEIIKEAQKQLIKKLFDYGAEYGPKVIKWIGESLT